MTDFNHPMFGWQHDSDGVVIITMDDPDNSANTANERFTDEFPVVLDHLEAMRDSIAGVVLTSSKKTFFAGADLTTFVTAGPEEIPGVEAMLNRLKENLRRLETLGRPVVAAINGAALGGGYEISLACHLRVVVNSPGAVVGLPESTLGLLAGAGGVVRTVRMFGVEKALNEILLPGTRFTPDKALEAGLVDEVVDSADELIAAAKRLIAQHPDPGQPWDAPGYCIPGGSTGDSHMAPVLTMLPALLRTKTQGAPAPAAEAILSAAVEGAAVDFETAQAIESRYCAALVGSQISSNIIKAKFFDPRAIRNAQRPLAGAPPFRAEKVLVIGGGPVAEGVAAACAAAGIEVSTVTAGSIENASTDIDVVIESVFEDAVARRQLLAAVLGKLGPETLVLSNSSALPIGVLAAGDAAPERFVGMHFFAPVERMPLVEVIAGEKTSDKTLSKALDFARQIGKSAIIVGDGPGFFTTRILHAYLDEALLLLTEGVPASSIECAATRAGYPVGPLALLDDLSFPVMGRICAEIIGGGNLDATGSTVGSFIQRMDGEFGRSGRASGLGFYDYAQGRRRGTWSGLSDAVGVVNADIAFSDLQERLLFREALEAIHCFDDGVARTVPEANVGSILGVGFPAWTGGALQYANQYDGGLAGFVARCEELAQVYGPRFTPTSSLCERAESNCAYE